MATQTPRTLIQNALEKAAYAGPFYAVKNNQTADGSTDRVVIDDTAAVKPGSSYANELTSQWGMARNGAALNEERKGWKFELRVNFNQEVTLEFFELALGAGILIDKATVAAKCGASFNFQVRISLVGARIQHPPRQQPATGTRAIYTFDATLSRNASQSC